LFLSLIGPRSVTSFALPTALDMTAETVVLMVSPLTNSGRTFWGGGPTEKSPAASYVVVNLRLQVLPSFSLLLVPSPPFAG
jgi:hypothetical protein